MGCRKFWSAGSIKVQATFSPWGSGLLDYAFLRAVAVQYHCQNYLEIGTYIGESIKAVSDVCEKCYSITAAKEAPYSMNGLCRRYDYPDYSDRMAIDNNVIHYYNDSKLFDYTQIPRDIDLYFIDGDHSYNGVYWDTKNVFKHKNKKAIVVWHDFKTGMHPMDMNSAVAVAVKDALQEEFANVFVTDNNMCGIYLPKELQKNLKLNAVHYTEEKQPLWAYECTIKPIKY